MCAASSALAWTILASANAPSASVAASITCSALPSCDHFYHMQHTSLHGRSYRMLSSSASAHLASVAASITCNTLPSCDSYASCSMLSSKNAPSPSVAASVTCHTLLLCDRVCHMQHAFRLKPLFGGWVLLSIAQRFPL